MAIRQLDELQSIRKELDAVSAAREIEKYFSEMDLPEDEIEKRIAIANDFQRFFMGLFVALLTAEVTRDEVIRRISEGYVRILDRHDLRPNMGHIERLSETIADNTLSNIDTEWYTSTDRSVKIAETETNNSANYEDLQEAIDNGYTQKTWLTMQDNKVRESHVALDGVTVGIDDLFQVGEAEMRFPCDEELAFDYPEEIANCRCVCTYS